MAFLRRVVWKVRTEDRLAITVEGIMLLLDDDLGGECALFAECTAFVG